jgi:hypothetical protein
MGEYLAFGLSHAKFYHEIVRRPAKFQSIAKGAAAL